jgi:hypothetical protein
MTTKTDEQDRFAFEAEYSHAYPVAASRPGKFDREDWGDYVDASVGIGWRMYQAGRAALQSQKPEPNDLMLYGVLCMPFDMAMANELSRVQFYQRAQQALNELEYLQSQLDFLIAEEATVEKKTTDRYGTTYRVRWPYLGEAITEWFRTPRDAIDRARRIEGDGK